MKIQLKELKKIVEDSVKHLLEEKNKTSKVELEDSLDSQVDSYFVKYEKEATSLKKEGFDFRTMTRNFLLEAEDDKEEKKDEPAKEPSTLTIEDINIESFSNSVVRLIDNYDSLLEVRDTIVRRAINFLSKNYDKSVIETFKEVLEEQYDIELGKNQSEEKFSRFPAPPADRAMGPGGGGA
jgi:hypothetical protein